MWEFIKFRDSIFWFSSPYVLPELHQRIGTIDHWTWQTVSPSVVRNVILPESMPRTRFVRREAVSQFQRRLTLIWSYLSPCLFQIIALLTPTARFAENLPQ